MGLLHHGKKILDNSINEVDLHDSRLWLQGWNISIGTGRRLWVELPLIRGSIPSKRKGFYVSKNFSPQCNMYQEKFVQL
jgi:hypothetical protein